MKLNCKPGDLAFVMPRRNGEPCEATGKLVEVMRSAPSCNFQAPDGVWFLADSSRSVPCWLVKCGRPAEHVDLSGGPARSSFFDVMPDSRLRPITDPGDDAVDETLLWLPVPECEAAA